MGWGSGKNAEGRDVGYLIEAWCDYAGCDVRIDRGLAYVCGGMHDGGEHGCGKYFCADHLVHVMRPNETWSPQLCDVCADSFVMDVA